MPEVHLLLAAAFSSVVLNLFIPPIRRFNSFIETLQTAFRQNSSYFERGYAILQFRLSRFFTRLLERFGF